MPTRRGPHKKAAVEGWPPKSGQPARADDWRAVARDQRHTPNGGCGDDRRLASFGYLRLNAAQTNILTISGPQSPAPDILQAAKFKPSAVKISLREAFNGVFVFGVAASPLSEHPRTYRPPSR